MKLRMEFEVQDFEEMITEFFSARGFSLEHPERLVEAFNHAFPEGLQVLVSPLNLTKKVIPEIQLVEETEETVAREPVEEPRLTAADLLDPTIVGAPSRDELLRQQEIEMRNILKTSEKIKNDVRPRSR